LSNRNPTWDYEPTSVFEIGTAKTPDLFRIGVNTRKNSMSQEDYAVLEAKLMKTIAGVKDPSLGTLIIRVRPVHNPDSGLDTDW
jgi:hypothetical protein